MDKVYLAVDVKACRIQKPNKNEELDWCAKAHSHVWKYQVSCNLVTGVPCTIDGPYHGIYHDSLIYDYSNLKQFLLSQNEYTLGLLFFFLLF